MRVKDVMSQPVLTVAPEATLKEVAALLAEHAISGMPVVDASGELVGVVSKTDILRKESADAGERGGLLGLLRGGDDPALALKVQARTVAGAMTAPVLAIDPERPVAAAASMMLDNRVNRLPVLSGGELVGIVTRSDLVRAFTRPDADIEREIRDEVVLASFWLPKGAVTVAVQDGVVQLRGGTETKADAEILPEMVRRVVGVVAVEAALTWRVDRTVEFEQSRS